MNKSVRAWLKAKRQEYLASMAPAVLLAEAKNGQKAILEYLTTTRNFFLVCAFFAPIVLLGLSDGYSNIWYSLGVFGRLFLGALSGLAIGLWGMFLEQFAD